MPIFAKGTNSWGRCGKCGDRHKLLDLVEDQHTKGLPVCNTCFDIYHPAREKFNPEDGIALKKPAPDTDIDSSADAGVTPGTTLVSALGFTNSFGGGT